MKEENFKSSTLSKRISSKIMLDKGWEEGGTLVLVLKSSIVDSEDSKLVELLLL
jgi:hypothetical protein